MRTKTQRWRDRIAAALSGLALLGAALGAQTKVGTTAGQFLGISVGPRAMAMGAAYAADISDVSTIYWNPASFQQAGKSQLMFSHTDWLVGTKFSWLGLMIGVGSENAIGFSLTQLDYGEEDVTTVAKPDGTGERWSAADLAIGISYSRRLTDRFSMGGTVKYIEQRIWNERATAFAFDLGLLFVTGFNDMRLGVSMSNFGGDLKLDGKDLLLPVDIDPANSGSNKALTGSLKTDPWALPLMFRVGLAMDVVKENQFRVTVAVDALRPTDSEESVNAGTEIAWNDMVFLRGGYKSLFGKDTEEGASFGAGLKYGVLGLGAVQVDYAFTKFGLFGNLNTIALAISF